MSKPFSIEALQNLQEARTRGFSIPSVEWVCVFGLKHAIKQDKKTTMSAMLQKIALNVPLIMIFVCDNGHVWAYLCDLLREKFLARP